MSETPKPKFDPTEHFMKLSGKDYLPVAPRIVWFREEHGLDLGWAIVTELVAGGFEAGHATVRATIVDPQGRVVASGTKTEEKGKGGRDGGFPEWVEKAETGAIGRALSFCGFGTLQALELEERDVCDTPQRAPQPGKSQQGGAGGGGSRTSPTPPAASSPAAGSATSGPSPLLHALHGYLNQVRDYGVKIALPPGATPESEISDLGAALKGLLKALPRAKECGIPTQETLAPIAAGVRSYRAALERLIQAHDEEALSAPAGCQPSAQAAGL